MTQMEEIANTIEKYRSYLYNLINKKSNLNDLDIIVVSQKLDKQLNIYYKVNEKMCECFECFELS